MQKEAATKIIKETFNSSFDKGRFAHFIRNLLNSIDEDTFIYRGNYIPDAYDEYIKTLERVGKYKDPDGKKIDILVVKLKKETSLEYARTMQRNFIAWYLDGSRSGDQKDAALVAFVSPNGADWRFSLVKMDYALIRSESGRIKSEKELTPARRWSFLVGEHENSHTAQKQLFPILEDDNSNPTLGNLEKVFDIEVVTEEFFDRYRDLFNELVDELYKLADKDKKIKLEFEKGTYLYDQEDISKKEKYEKFIASFAKKLLGQIVFLYFLQKKGWFGVTLKDDWGSGPKDFLRELFNKKHGDYENFFDEILEPLFYEALAKERDKDYYSRFKCRIPFLNGGLFDPLGNYDWVNIKIQLPNEVFSNTKKTKQGDRGTGILDVFDRYNFTVKEDEPLEKDVAVDPEMLGKVFENLLEVKDRKSKGTYYTPREIVHYMCQESLITYLATELEEKVDKRDIEALVKYGESFVEHDARVSENGKETSTYSYKIPESIRKIAKLIDEKLEEIRVCDPAVGSGAFLVGKMSEIVRTRNVLTLHLKDRKERTIYNFKRHAIQSSLYGVDIDAGAVEIAKLRLWLSLIVDESEFKEIQPLPNLDYKIVAGNSLLNVEKGSLFLHQDFANLKELKQKYFNETSAKKKDQYKKQINTLISKITNDHKEFDFEVYFSEVFQERGGFDVVIENPPYGETPSLNTTKIKNKYAVVEGKFEIYKFFIEQSLNILKPNGVATFITPNTWLKLSYFQKLRQLILQKNSLVMISETFDKVFESATVNTIIFMIQKSCPTKKTQLISEDLGSFVIIEGFFDDDFSINFIEKDSLIKKVDQSGYQLKDIYEVTQGLIAYASRKQSRIWTAKRKQTKLHRKILYGREISPYRINWQGDYLKYGSWLHRKRPDYVFDNPKIFVQRIRNPKLKRRIIATLDTKQYLATNGLSIILEKQDPTHYVPLEFALALLNSKLINHWFSFYFKDVNIKPEQLRKIPIPFIILMKTREQKPFIDLVDKILAITKGDDYLESPVKQAKVREYEKKIDQLIYKLYGLTTEEIKIIENEK